MLERFSLKSCLTAECVLHSVDQPVGGLLSLGRRATLAEGLAAEDLTGMALNERPEQSPL